MYFLSIEFLSVVLNFREYRFDGNKHYYTFTYSQDEKITVICDYKLNTYGKLALFIKSQSGYDNFYLVMSNKMEIIIDNVFDSIDYKYLNTPA